MAVIIDNWVECLTTIWMIFDTLTEVNLQLVKKIIYMKVVVTGKSQQSNYDGQNCWRKKKSSLP